VKPKLQCVKLRVSMPLSGIGNRKPKKWRPAKRQPPSTSPALAANDPKSCHRLRPPRQCHQRSRIAKDPIASLYHVILANASPRDATVATAFDGLYVISADKNLVAPTWSWWTSPTASFACGSASSIRDNTIHPESIPSRSISSRSSPHCSGFRAGPHPVRIFRKLEGVSELMDTIIGIAMLPASTAGGGYSLNHVRRSTNLTARSRPI